MKRAQTIVSFSQLSNLNDCGEQLAGDIDDRQVTACHDASFHRDGHAGGRPSVVVANMLGAK